MALGPWNRRLTTDWNGEYAMQMTDIRGKTTRRREQWLRTHRCEVFGINLEAGTVMDDNLTTPTTAPSEISRVTRLQPYYLPPRSLTTIDGNTNSRAIAVNYEGPVKPSCGVTNQCLALGIAKLVVRIPGGPHHNILLMLSKAVQPICFSRIGIPP